MQKTFAALAEPNRMRIVELLRQGPLTVGEIAERLGLQQPQTSKHLKVLTDSGIVAMKPAANRRIYSLEPATFESLNQWLRSFQPTPAERLENLDDYLRTLQEKSEQRATTDEEE